MLRRLGPSRLYIDVGANHPRYNSNTYLLYLNGWTGLTLEPIRSLCALHRALRPNDVCINAAMGAAPSRAEFYELRPSGLSTFDRLSASALVDSGGAANVGHYTVDVSTVADAWRSNFGDQRPSLLSVDCEGMEMDVLAGSQISVLRPELVLLEFQSATGEARREQLIDAMAEYDYKLVDEYGVNGLFAAFVVSDMSQSRH